MDDEPQNAIVVTSRTVLAYKTCFAFFSVYRNRFLKFWSYFYVLKLGVYVCLVKSLLILSFSFIKTAKGELKNSKFGGKTSVTLSQGP